MTPCSVRNRSASSAAIPATATEHASTIERRGKDICPAPRVEYKAVFFISACHAAGVTVVAPGGNTRHCGATGAGQSRAGSRALARMASATAGSGISAGDTEATLNASTPISSTAMRCPSAPLAVVGTAAWAAGGVTPERVESYRKLQRELEALPGDIDAKEQQIAAVEAQMADAGFYQRPSTETAAVIAQLEKLQAELDVLVERWAELDA